MFAVLFVAAIMFSWSMKTNLKIRRTIFAIYQLGGSGNLIREISNGTAPVRRLLVIVRWRNPMISTNVDEVLYPGPWFDMKMPSYQHKKSHCGDKTVVRSSNLHKGFSYTVQMSFLYWIRAQARLCHVYRPDACVCNKCIFILPRVSNYLSKCIYFVKSINA